MFKSSNAFTSSGVKKTTVKSYQLDINEAELMQAKDVSGKIVVPFDKGFEYVYPAGLGFMLVGKDDRYGLYSTKKEELVIPLQYISISGTQAFDVSSKQLQLKVTALTEEGDEIKFLVHNDLVVPIVKQTVSSAKW